MSKTSCVKVVLLSLPFWLLPPALPVASAQEKDLPLKVLEKRVGTWTTHTRGKSAEWTPEAFENKGEEKIELIMNGRFLQGKVRTQPGNVEALWLTTFDVDKKAFRLWYFSSQGDIVETLGQWDAKAKVMTWTNEPQPGVTAIAHWRFVSDDVFEWDLRAKDRAGKVYLDMTGKLTRKK
jgi:hypothetical protein